ncbi:hypothetical protein V5O48_014694 [Marasmius crinis-equi]|uniref:Uncharacterized protein n=1 Tax=Marasmius crinis-equi TaxID=585013 RepID=A0ABR3EWL7_9AGAR
MHRPGHEEKEHEKFNLNLIPGVAHIDGESCERVWGNHNGLSNSTKMMGPGARQDLLEAMFEFWNWEKYKNMGMFAACFEDCGNNSLTGIALYWKLREALEEEAKQTEEHEDLTANLEKELVLAWEGEIVHGSSRGTKGAGIGGRGVIEARGGSIPQDVSGNICCGVFGPEGAAVSDLVFWGIVSTNKVEHRARLKLGEGERVRDTTVRQTRKLTEQRNTIRRLVINLEEVRVIYMPGLIQYLRDLGEGEEAEDERKAEDIHVWLPSSLETGAHGRVCVPGLSEVEAKLQKAKALDALDGLAKNFAQQYRASREAFYKVSQGLTGGEKGKLLEEELPVLKDEDIRSYKDPALVKIGPGRRGTDEWVDGKEGGSQRSLRGASGGVDLIPRDAREGHRIIVEDGADDGNKLLRLEWCRSRARSERAKEEVLLIREEMRGTLEYLEWTAKEWDRRCNTGEPGEKGLEEGRWAYGVEQAEVQRCLKEEFAAKWAKDPDITKPEEENDDGERDVLGDDNDDDEAVEDDDEYE